MKNVVVGYVSTIGGVLVSILALASLGDARPNYLVTAVLLAFALGALGVGWYRFREDA